MIAGDGNQPELSIDADKSLNHSGGLSPGNLGRGFGRKDYRILCRSLTLLPILGINWADPLKIQDFATSVTCTLLEEMLIVMSKYCPSLTIGVVQPQDINSSA